MKKFTVPLIAAAAVRAGTQKSVQDELLEALEACVEAMGQIRPKDAAGAYAKGKAAIARAKGGE